MRVSMIPQPSHSGYIPRQVWVILIRDGNNSRVHPEGFAKQAEANVQALRLNRSGMKVTVVPVSINSWGDFGSQNLWFGKD